MHEARRFIPKVLLAVMTVLAAAGAVWGLHNSTPSASMTVQSATAATYGDPLGDQSFSLDLTNAVSSGRGAGVITQVRRIVYTPPGTMKVAEISPTPKHLGHLSPAVVQVDLVSYAAATGGSVPWTQHGTQFTRVESLADFSVRVHQQATVNGTMYETATVSHGYLVKLMLRAVFQRQLLASGQIAAAGVVGETFALRQIDGHPAP